MIAKFRRSWRLPMYLCGVSLGLMLLYLCTHDAFGQTPPGGGGSEPSVQFSASSYTVAEGNPIDITVTLSSIAYWPVSVAYATSDGTGKAGVDYQSLSGTLPFPQGATQEFFTVTTMNDPNNTSYVTVNLTLSSPSGATLGSPSTATLYIVNPSACQ